MTIQLTLSYINVVSVFSVHVHHINVIFVVSRQFKFYFIKAIYIILHYVNTIYVTLVYVQQGMIPLCQLKVVVSLAKNCIITCQLQL